MTNVTLVLHVEIMNTILDGKQGDGMETVTGKEKLKISVPVPPSQPLQLKPTHLISCQDPEGCHNLLGSVRISRLSGHEVDKRLEGDDPCCI